MCKALSGLGVNANITEDVVAQPAELIILTEGTITATDTSVRHWRVLQQCQALHAQDTPIVILGHHDQSDLGALSGLQGLSRTLRQEWPQATINALDVSPISSADEIATTLLTSAPEGSLLNDKLLSVHVAGDALALPTQGMAPADGNWLITGGARGVTATCTIELARHVGSGKFFLAGRSDVVEWPANVPACDDIQTLRGALIQATKQKGERPRLASIEKQARALLAGQEVRNTLTALRQQGVEAHYIKLDISNRNDVQTTLSKLTKAHGPVTGLIHGAGLLSDKLALKKTEEDVAHVFAPKVDGLLNIFETMDLASLNYCGLFSSAAAVFGNPGQSDYAMANTWLNAVASRLHAEYDQLQVKSFCWGPWAGGMVDDTLAAHFAERGIPLIGLQEGAEIFAHHLLYGEREEVNLLIGDHWQS